MKPEGVPDKNPSKFREALLLSMKISFIVNKNFPEKICSETITEEFKRTSPLLSCLDPAKKPPAYKTAALNFCGIYSFLLRLVLGDDFDVRVAIYNK